MSKIALITGITGQDGSYLAELLLPKPEYAAVWGIVRRASNLNTMRIDHLYSNKKLILVHGDLSDGPNLLHIFHTINEKHPDLESLEVYNLGAMSHVKVSFEMPEYCADVDAVGTLRLLEAARATGLQLKTRFYQASTSELYGLVQEIPQTEKTPFYPRSPYGVAKLYAYWIVKNYRESYNTFACNGVLFNHESPRRGPTFVTRKITRGLAMIMRGERDVLELGNLDAKRDWGHARDFVKAMWKILQLDEPDDFVISTGESHTVREFVETAFGMQGYDIKWQGSGVNETGVDSRTGRTLIIVHPRYFRPAEVEQLLGDCSKAKAVLGWEPETSFRCLVEDMVKTDCGYIRALSGPSVSPGKHRLLVTGGTGLVGRAIQECVSALAMADQCYFLSSRDCDLTNADAVNKLFDEFKPTKVIHLAAEVGGLFKNMRNQSTMLQNNLCMNQNVINASHKHGVQRLIACLSTCVFPAEATYPLTEDQLHSGAPHNSNYGYAYSKRVLEVHCRALNEQFGREYICVIPTNVYGIHDNFSLEDGHVIPCLVHRAYLAKTQAIPFVVRGSGKPLRQFINSSDLARLMFLTLEKYTDTEPVILSVPPKDEVSISFVADCIASYFGLSVQYDTSFSDGQFRKPASSARLEKLKCEHSPDFEFVDLKDGISDVCKWFDAKYESTRK